MDKNPTYLRAANGKLRLALETLQISVRVLRKARGKANPDELPIGSAAWVAATEDFAQEVLAVLGFGQRPYAEGRSIPRKDGDRG